MGLYFMVNLVEELRGIAKRYKLNEDLILKIVSIDGERVIGPYEGFTQALDNEPEIASIDIGSGNTGWGYEIYENEIKSIEVIRGLKMNSESLLNKGNNHMIINRRSF